MIPPASGAAKPKVLIAHQWKADRGLYGADRVVLRILREIAPFVDPIIVVESEGQFTDAARQLSCQAIVRPMGVLRRKQMNLAGLPGCAYNNLKSSLWMARFIRKQDIRLVVTSTVSVIPGAVAAKLAGRPHLWLVQEILGGYAAALSFFVSAMSARIVAVSEASARSIHRGRISAARKTVVAYPGVDVQLLDRADGTAIRQSFSTPEQPVLIGLVGRLHYWKGQEYFLEALHELKKRNIGGFRALIVGDAYKDYPEVPARLRQKAAQLGLENEVVFCGQRDDIHAVFRALDIAVAPSILPEPFSLVVAEAMAAQLPVIATAWGGPREMIEDGVSGFLIPPNDPVCFSLKLEQLLRSDPLRREVGRAARRRIETAFTASAFDAKFLAEVRSMILPASR